MIGGISLILAFFAFQTPHGIAETDLMPEGKVFVRGEYWNAVSDERILKGEKVEVIAVEGLRVTVKKVAPAMTF